MSAPFIFLSRPPDEDRPDQEGATSWGKRQDDENVQREYSQQMKEHHHGPSSMESPNPISHRHLPIQELDTGAPSFHHALIPSRDETTSPSCPVPEIQISPPPDNPKKNMHHPGLTVDTRSYECIRWPGYMGLPSNPPSPTLHPNGCFELDRRSYSSDSGISVSGSTYSSPSHHHMELEEARRDSQSCTLAPEDWPRARSQCPDHGCNGRSFAIFGTVLPHEGESQGERECQIYDITQISVPPTIEHVDEIMKDVDVAVRGCGGESSVDSTSTEKYPQIDCSLIMTPPQSSYSLAEPAGSSTCQTISLSEPQLYRFEFAQDDLKQEDVGTTETYPEMRVSADSSSGSEISSNTEADSLEDEDDGCTRFFHEKKKALLDRLMAHFYTMFNSQSSPSPSWPVQSCSPGENETPGSASTPRTRENSEVTSHPSSVMASGVFSANLSTSRKRQSIEEEDDGDEFPSRKRPKWNASGQADAGEILPKLACPFFKNNPDVYRKHRSCPGPGWSTVHRVKEHVYRRHALPITCPRCHEIFETDRLKDEHTAAALRCQAREAPPIEGMNATQKELLRCRKRTVKNMEESEKWREMYLVLFPGTVDESIPSPYYEYKSTATQLQDGATSEFTRYEQFLRSELPPRVRRELETRLDETLNPIEENLRSELVGIVRDMQIQLFDMYKSSRGAASHTEDDNPIPGSAIPGPSSSSLAGPSQFPSIEDALEPFNQPPDAENLQDFGEFDGLLFNLHESDGSVGLDSGYQSLLFDNNKANGDGRFDFN